MISLFRMAEATPACQSPWGTSSLVEGLAVFCWGFLMVICCYALLLLQLSGALAAGQTGRQWREVGWLKHKIMLWQYADVLCWKKKWTCFVNHMAYGINRVYFWSLLSSWCFPVQHWCEAKQSSLVTDQWSAWFRWLGLCLIIIKRYSAALVSDQIVDILCQAEKMSMSEKGHITASTNFGLNIALILSTYTAHIQ